MNNEQKADAIHDLANKLERDIELITGSKKWSFIIAVSLDGELSACIPACGEEITPRMFAFDVCDAVSRMFCNNQYGHNPDILPPKP